MRRPLLLLGFLTVCAANAAPSPSQPWPAMAPAFEKLARHLESQSLAVPAGALRRDMAGLQGRSGSFTFDPRFHRPIPAPGENWYFLRIAPALDEILKKPVALPFRKDIVTAIPTPNELSSRADEAVGLAWAFTHPDSPWQGDPAIFEALLFRLELVFHGHQGGDFLAGRKSTDNNYNIFPWAGLLRAAAMLHVSAKDLLPESLLADWREQTRLGVRHQIEKGFETQPTFKRYFNIDARYMSQLAAAAVLTGDPALSNRADEMLTALTRQTYPDGAFAYIFGENESFSYHQSGLIDLAEYAFLTGSPRARDMIVQSTNYYPLSLMTGGVSEYSTVPNWKTTWNAAGLPLGPDLVAFFSKDPRNAWIGWNARRTFPSRPPLTELILGAACFPTGVARTPPATNFLVFDRNVQGPRGRFGYFGWILDGRNRGDEHPGKLTHVSLQITDDDGRYMPLNAALMTVGSRFKWKDGAESWSDSGYATVHERDTPMLGRDFASLSTHHDFVRLGYGQTTSPLPGWEGSQVWLATPRRVVGLVRLETSAETKAWSRSGVIKLGYGAAGWSGTWTNSDGTVYTGPCFIPKRLTNLGENHWGFGKLRIRLHGGDYPAVRIREQVGSLRDDRTNAAELLLEDRGEPGQRLAAGSQKYYVVEFHPQWQKPATVQHQEMGNGLTRLSVRDEDGEKTVFFNGTAKGQIVRHGSGRLYAPSLTPDIPVIPKSEAASGATGVKPWGHVVLEP